MGLLRKIILVGLTLFSSLKLFAQQFGGNPPSLRWNQVNTDTVRVIFPSGLANKAQSIATIAGKLGITQNTLGDRFKKINIVLQNQSTFSNGYVGLGPRRSEFYLNALQNSFDLGSLPWHEQLALHEFRHVQQYNNFNKGVSKLFYLLAGELGLTFANSTAVPNWFWEGDAVFQETQQSKQGRGRLPYFFNGYRSLWAAKKDYSWMKLRNGSLKDYVPNHYQIGYLFVAYGREKYGDSIWAKITNDAVRFKQLFYPFQKAVKKYTGVSYTNFTKEALSFYRGQLAEINDSINSVAQKEKHFTADEEFPQWVDKNHIVFVRSNYSSVPSFIKREVNTGKEVTLRTKDISIDNYFSARNEWVVYAATSYDARWNWRDYSEIRLLELNSGKQTTVTKRTKFFSPDISKDGQEIVVVEQKENGTNALHILDRTGNTLQKWEIPSNLFVTYPKFAGYDKIVCALRNDLGEMTLAYLDRKSGNFNPLLPFSMNVIGFPTVDEDTVYFTASDGQQDQLFAYSSECLKRFNPSRINNKATGSYSLAVSGSMAAWTDFTATGFKISVKNIEAGDFEKVDTTAIQPLPDYGITSIHRRASVIDTALNAAYSVQHYSKGFGLLNFHSWLPTISDPDYSVSFYSENILNTLQTELYFNYNTNEESKKVGFISAYGALYPWIRAGAAFTKDRRFNSSGNKVYWDETELRAGILIPWNFSGGLYFRSLRIGTDYIFVKPSFKGAYKDSIDGTGYGYINSYLNFTNQVQKARQNIFPRFAQTIRLDANRAITGNSGHQLLVSGLFYFPGVHVNHNLVINAAWQQRDTLRQLRFTNSFPFSRGYVESNYDQLIKFGVNYHFPLVYPDWGFGNIVYFLRLRGNLFYDYTYSANHEGSTKKLVYRNFKSFGGELFFDTKWWNQQPVSFGFRYSRLIDGQYQGLGPNQFEFVLPVNLINR